MNLSPTLMLRRAEGLRMRLDSYHELRITLPAGSFSTGYHGLAVLHAFSEPRSVASALAALGPRLAGPQDWIELTSTIARLYQGGALVGDGPAPTPLNDTPYDHAIYAIEPLNNQPLVDALLGALRAAVTPGAVVVDLAGSTGLLAIAAALAGAGRVCVRPAAGATELLKAGIAANGVEDRVHLLAAGAPLPQADLLLSEQLLSSPFERGLIAELRQAAGCLAAGGRPMPTRLRRMAIPVAVPAETRARQTFTPTTMVDWRAWYGIDFGPCAAAAARTPRLIMVPPAQVRAWSVLGEPALLFEEAVTGEEQAVRERHVTLTARAAGAIDGLLILSELDLGDGRALHNNPAAGDAVAVSLDVWMLAEPVPVEPGARLLLTYSEPAATAALWATLTPA